jgi:negative regulator of sigma E activity
MPDWLTNEPPPWLAAVGLVALVVVAAGVVLTVILGVACHVIGPEWDSQDWE